MGLRWMISNLRHDVIPLASDNHHDCVTGARNFASEVSRASYSSRTHGTDSAAAIPVLSHTGAAAVHTPRSISSALTAHPAGPRAVIDAAPGGQPR